VLPGIPAEQSQRLAINAPKDVVGGTEEANVAGIYLTTVKSQLDVSGSSFFEEYWSTGCKCACQSFPGPLSHIMESFPWIGLKSTDWVERERYLADSYPNGNPVRRLCNGAGVRTGRRFPGKAGHDTGQ
jgi:hypothetical protein